MGIQIRVGVFLAGLCISLFVGGVSGIFFGHHLWYTPPSPLEQGSYLFIEEVTDGDTMVIRMGDERVRVRLMGIDTPETVDKRRAAQCFGDKASAQTKKLAGQTLRFEFISPEFPAVKRDQFNRPLVYLHLPNGELYNEKLIRDGLAHEYTYKGGYKYREQLKAAEADARKNKRGMWQNEMCAAESSRPKR